MSVARNMQYQDAETTPYRSVHDDLELFQKANPKKFSTVAAILRDLNPTGVNWNAYADTWEEFTQRDDVIPVKNLVKDMEAQRPIDFDHLTDLIKDSQGIFDHAQYGSIDQAVRPDGSKNVWDCWHTTLFAFISGCTHVRVSRLIHIDNKTLEECRDTERTMFERRNVKNLRTTAGQAFDIAVKRKLKAIKDGKLKSDSEVAVNKIFSKLNITVSGKKSTYTFLDGLVKIKNARMMMQNHYMDDSLADNQLESLLRLFQDVFPKEKIDATMIEALAFDLILFADVAKMDLFHWRKFFEAQKVSGAFPTINSYSKGTVKLKHKSKESLGLFLAYSWNEWMAKSKTVTKRPITIAKAKTAFNVHFDESFVNSIWVQTTGTIKVQCKNCGSAWEQKIKI